MAEGYWNRQQPITHHQQGVLKRHRTEYGHEIPRYLPEESEHHGPRSARDTRTIGSAYDRYLQSTQTTGLNPEGVGYGRAFSGGILDNSGMSRYENDIGLDLARNGRTDMTSFDAQIPMDAFMGGPGHENLPLPLDASSTLYVEGLPSDCSRREVAHIFRPFVGYKDARLVSKESRNRGGDPLILCFVDFANPACAATAMSALQGYRLDEHNPESSHLRLQFSRSPGPRSSGFASRGKR